MKIKSLIMILTLCISIVGSPVVYANTKVGINTYSVDGNYKYGGSSLEYNNTTYYAAYDGFTSLEINDINQVNNTSSYYANSAYTDNPDRTFIVVSTDALGGTVKFVRTVSFGTKLLDYNNDYVVKNNKEYFAPVDVSIAISDLPYEVVKSRIHVPFIVNRDNDLTNTVNNVKTWLQNNPDKTIDDFPADFDWVLPEDLPDGEDFGEYDETIPNFTARAKVHLAKFWSNATKADGYEFFWAPYDSKYALEVKCVYSYNYMNLKITNELWYKKADEDPLLSASESYLGMYGRDFALYLKENDPRFVALRDNQDDKDNMAFVNWWISLFQDDEEEETWNYGFMPSKVYIRLATFEDGVKKVGNWTMFKVNKDKEGNDIISNALNPGTGDDDSTIDYNVQEHETKYPVGDDGKADTSKVEDNEEPVREYDPEGNVTDHWTVETFDGTLDSFFEFIKGLGSTLDNVVKLFGKLFSFLPTGLIVLLAASITGAIICRFLGR